MKNRLSKNNLYLLLAVLLIIFVVGGLLIFLKTAKPLTTNKPNNAKTEFVFDSNKYKAAVRDLYIRLSADDPSTAKEVKQKLLAMTVSKEYKDVHLELVMASASLEDYSLSRNEASLNKAKTILSNLKKDYSWLADKSL